MKRTILACILLAAAGYAFGQTARSGSVPANGRVVTNEQDLVALAALNAESALRTNTDVAILGALVNETTVRQNADTAETAGRVALGVALSNSVSVAKTNLQGALNLVALAGSNYAAAVAAVAAGATNAAHLAAADPHGDRAYAAGLLATGMFARATDATRVIQTDTQAWFGVSGGSAVVYRVVVPDGAVATAVIVRVTQDMSTVNGGLLPVGDYQVFGHWVSGPPVAWVEDSGVVQVMGTWYFFDDEVGFKWGLYYSGTFGWRVRARGDANPPGNWYSPSVNSVLGIAVTSGVDTGTAMLFAAPSTNISASELATQHGTSLLFSNAADPIARAGVGSNTADIATLKASSITARLMQPDTQAWVSVVNGTAMLWRVQTFIPDIHGPLIITATSGAGYQGPALNTTYAWQGSFNWWAGGPWNGKFFYTGTQYQEQYHDGSGNWNHWTNAGSSFPTTFFPTSDSPSVGSFTADYIRQAPQTSSVPMVASPELNAVVNNLAALSNLVSLMKPANYPVFQLEMGGVWTDFLLKGSQDNFATTCYVVSSSSGDLGHGDGDANVMVYYTDDYSDDPRAWHASPPGVSILSQMADPTNGVISSVIVCPSHECDTPWASWMNPDNTHLVWSYLRMTGFTFETNTTGHVSGVNVWTDAAHWRPVQPIGWRKERLTP